MKNILDSLSISVNQNFSELIRQSLHSLKKETNHNTLLEETADSDDDLDIIDKEAELMALGLVLNESCDIGELLIQHQKRILNRSNLPENFDIYDNLDEINNENTQLLSDELVLEEDFFDKINRIFRKKHEKMPLTIMQIMSDFRGKLGVLNFLY